MDAGQTDGQTEREPYEETETDQAGRWAARQTEDPTFQLVLQAGDAFRLGAPLLQRCRQFDLQLCRPLLVGGCVELQLSHAGNGGH